jgi:hypothetical protein
MRVFSEVNIVIEIHKIMARHLPVNRSDHHYQEYSYQKFGTMTGHAKIILFTLI